MPRNRRCDTAWLGGFVLPRSGLALEHGLSVVNSPGLIDSAYRGELKVVLINTDPTDDYEVSAATASHSSCCSVGGVTWNEVDELSGDDRGGGFGHSGR